VLTPGLCQPPANRCEPVNRTQSERNHRLLILGAGGHAKVLADTALAAGLARNIAFLDDKLIASLLGWSVLGALSLCQEPALVQRWPQAAVAIGDAATRLAWLDRLQSLGYQLPVVVHPSAAISSRAQLGPGSVGFAGAVVQADAQLGRGVILNSACSLDHDCGLGDGVHICPGAHLAVAGAAVVRDLPDGVTAVGVPAKVRAPA